jgi:glycosyltransferase involved in cell wall biosynthesis
MKINYILPQFPAGREAFAQNDIDALVNMGHQVEVFSYRKSTVTSPLNGVSVITSEIQCILYVFLNFKLFLSGLLFCVQNYSGLKSFLKSLVYMVQSFSFVERYKKHMPDVVHFFWGHYPSILIYFLSKVDQSNTVTKTMFLGAYDLHEQWRGSISIANKYADMVFTHAYKNKSKLIDFGIYEDKITVIYRGVNIPKNERLRSSENKNLITLLSEGALIKDKRHDLSISIAAELLKNDTDVILKIAGQGPERDKLLRHAQSLGILPSKIEMLGHLDKVNLQNTYQQSDYLIALSQHKSECLPNVVKEAMSNGCIPIVSNSFAIEELVNDGVNGFVFDMDHLDVTIMMQSIMNLQNDTPKRCIFEDAGESWISAKFDTNQNMQKYISTWQTLMRGT